LHKESKPVKCAKNETLSGKQVVKKRMASTLRAKTVSGVASPKALLKFSLKDIHSKYQLIVNVV
jgi:hypothetical protein